MSAIGTATAVSPAPVRRTVTRARPRRLRSSQVVAFVFLLIAAAFFAVPLYVIVVTSFKTMDQIRQGEIFSLPHPWTAGAWQFAWSEACSGMSCHGVKAGFVNSLLILAPSLVLTISLAIITGYGLALWNVRWANGFLFTLFICAFVPFQIIMYPLIKIASALHIYGTTFGIAVIHTALALPFLTMIFRNYFRGIPAEIMAAAMLDSGSFWRIFIEIVLPMSGNIMIVVLILMVTGIWNDFLVGLTFGSQDTQPMTVILNNTVATTTGAKNYANDMAAALLTALPPLAIYVVLGRFFVQGITAGAIKG